MPQSVASETRPAGGEPVRARSPVAVVETALILVGLAGFGFVLPHYTVADAAVRYNNLLSLLDHGRLLAGPYSLVGPMFATPLVLLGRAVGHERGVVQLYNTGVFAAGLLCLYLLLRPGVDRGLLRRFLLLLIAGSMFSAHVVHWNSEVLTAMTVAVGLTAIAVRRWAATGWTAVVLGVVNTPAAIVGFALSTGRRMMEDRRLRYGLAVMAAAALIGTEHWIRNGSPANAGYGDWRSAVTPMPYSGSLNTFSYPFFFGLLSICLSFGKGLLFFAPGLLLPVRQTMKRIVVAKESTLYELHVLWLLFLGGLVLVYSPWWAWYGGVTWGPRFLLFASIPAALAIAVRLGDLAVALWVRILTLATCALSVWVGICGAIFIDAARARTCTMDGYQFEALCHYTPDYSVLWYPFVAHSPISATDLAVAGYFVVAFGYLAWPLVRSIAVDVTGSLRRRARGWLADWQW